MGFTFKPLWKQLIDKDMSKKDLMAKANISKSTIDKMGRGENISMEIVDRICTLFDCKVENVIEHTASRKEVSHE